MDSLRWGFQTTGLEFKLKLHKEQFHGEIKHTFQKHGGDAKRERRGQRGGAGKQTGWGTRPQKNRLESLKHLRNEFLFTKSHLNVCKVQPSSFI